MIINKFLKSLFIYELIQWIIGLIMIINGSYNAFSKTFNIELFFMTIIFFLITIWMIYVNFCLVFDKMKEDLFQFITFVKWINFIQIFKLTILGITLFWFEGPYLEILYVYDQKQQLGIHFKLFETSYGLGYRKSDLILAGINLLPLSIFLWLDNILRRKDTHS